VRAGIESLSSAIGYQFISHFISARIDLLFSENNKSSEVT